MVGAQDRAARCRPFLKSGIGINAINPYLKNLIHDHPIAESQNFHFTLNYYKKERG